MSSVSIVIAGCLGMCIAVIHGYLGETKVVRPAQGIPVTSKRVLHAVMFLSAIYWFVGGALLATGPLFLTASEQGLAALIVGTMFLTGAVGNFWATKGRHFGWILLTCALVLAWSGAWLR
ncbi:MAG: hypothetical protein ACR2PA_06890, partial [Hyphomicrobiaceae bacterium]